VDRGSVADQRKQEQRQSDREQQEEELRCAEPVVDDTDVDVSAMTIVVAVMAVMIIVVMIVHPVQPAVKAMRVDMRVNAAPLDGKQPEANGHENSFRSSAHRLRVYALERDPRLMGDLR
jgi:hypothetical protein